MKVYILTFTICLISDLLFNRGKIKLSKTFLVFAITLLCLLAAFRNKYVGRDIYNYLSMLFRDFTSGVSLIDELKSTRANGIEPLFMFLVLIFSKFNNLNVVFFFVQFAIVLHVSTSVLNTCKYADKALFKIL